MGYSRCVMECPVALGCARHDLSGSIPRMHLQSYMNRDPRHCLDRLPTGNKELKMEVSLMKMLEELARMLPSRDGRGKDWEAAYNNRGVTLAHQLRQLAQASSDHEMVVQLNEVADFYAGPVVDPEWGVANDGDSACIRDFSVAVVAVVRDRPSFADYVKRLDQLLTEFTN